LKKFDFGKWRNFESVMGKNKLYWFLPFKANLNGDGIKFIPKIIK